MATIITIFEEVEMSNTHFTAGEVAARLGIKRYRLEYLLSNGILPDTMRVGNRRVWTAQQVEYLEEQFREYEATRGKKEDDHE